MFPYPCVQLRQDGLRLLTLWLQALQSNAGDASMQLFASSVPHFPPQKTPMGLPSPSSSSSLHPHPSTHSLVERYGTYSSSDGASYLSAYRRASSASVNSFRGESVNSFRGGFVMTQRMSWFSQGQGNANAFFPPPHS